MLYEINFSKYISEKYPDCWCWKKVNADSKEEAINLLKDNGVFSAAIPSQGRFLWTMAYKLSTGIAFRTKYKLDYDVIMNYEHVNTQAEIIMVCHYFFDSVKKSLFGISDELSLYTHLSCRKPNQQKAREYLASLKHHEANSKTIQTADAMLQTVNGLKR